MLKAKRRGRRAGLYLVTLFGCLSIFFIIQTPAYAQCEIDWACQTVDSTEDVGWYTSLTFDASERPAISHYNWTNQDLDLARSWLYPLTWSFHAAGFFPKHLPDDFYGTVVLADLDPADIPAQVQGVWWYDSAILGYRFWVPGVGGDLTTLGGGHTYNYMVLVTGACEWAIPLASPLEGHVVVSLGELPESQLGQTPFPQGFEPKDEFAPCEWVWVWGYGFEYYQEYEIYIQPYIECNSVVEGQPLDHSLSATLGYPDPDPVRVHIGQDGTFEGGPVKLFHATEDMICTYWEIVADKIGAGHMAGFYNADEDGLDAVACDEPGFHIVPEALTIILLGVGLTGLGGYVGLRRRKSTETDA